MKKAMLSFYKIGRPMVFNPTDIGSKTRGLKKGL